MTFIPTSPFEEPHSPTYRRIVLFQSTNTKDQQIRLSILLADAPHRRPFGSSGPILVRLMPALVDNNSLPHDFDVGTLAAPPLETRITYEADTHVSVLADCLWFCRL